MNASIFKAMCAAHGLPEPTPEYRFDKKRRWRFDWAWLEENVALEIEGGAFRGPGHRSIGVFLKNIEKYNAATLAGWRLFRCTTAQVDDGSIFELLKKAMA